MIGEPFTDEYGFSGRLRARSTQPFELPGVDATLEVLEGRVDFLIPLFANSDRVDAPAAGPSSSSELSAHVHDQACDDHPCFIPRSRTTPRNVPLGKNAVPSFLNKAMGKNGFAGNEEFVDMDPDRHTKRLAMRQAGNLAKIRDGSKKREDHD